MVGFRARGAGAGYEGIDRWLDEERIEERDDYTEWGEPGLLTGKFTPDNELKLKYAELPNCRFGDIGYEW